MLGRLPGSLDQLPTLPAMLRDTSELEGAEIQAVDAVKWFPLERIHALEQRVAELAAHGDFVERRDALAVALGLHGLRVGEVIAAKNADLFVPTRMLSVATIKGGRPRKVSLDESVIAAIQKWQRECPFAAVTPEALMLPNRLGRRCRP